MSHSQWMLKHIFKNIVFMPGLLACSAAAFNMVPILEGEVLSNLFRFPSLCSPSLEHALCRSPQQSEGL